MKNFRKVLALVLVVATLFSFVAMTASAKDYTDTDKVSYTEAVDVLSNIGILNGYNDGSFKPTQTIKRSEMAKMIAVLANEGKDNIGEIYASACKFADMNGDVAWAKSYVAYCNQIGIVAGRNATTFDPTGKVTGIETAKMLLCMIGFDAKAQGYVGTNWKVNVLRDAEKVGLLENFAADFEADKAITREEAANMMLNALLAPMVVGTVSDSIVNISNTVWLELKGLKTTIKTITLTDAIDVYDCYILYGNVLVSNIPVWTNYAGLKVDDDARDCYGNPVTKWSYTNAYGKETWSAEYAHAYDYYYTTKSSVASDLDKLGPTSSELWVDGVDMTGSYNTPAALFQGVDNTYSGKGVEIKVYIDPYVVINANHTASIENKVVITVKNTYIGVVQDVVKAAGTFALKIDGTNVYFDNAGYGFDEGDVVLYWLCNKNAHGNGILHDAELATPVNVDLTYVYNAASGEADSWITGSTKKYEYAEQLGTYLYAGDGVEGDRLSITENRHDDNTFDLYLDKFGYIMGWVEVEPGVDDGYVYLVEGTGKSNPVSTDDLGRVTYNSTATTVDFTATMTENDKISRTTYAVMVEAMTGDGIGAAHGEDWSKCGHGVLVHYTMVNGEKHATYTDVATQAGNDVYLSENGNLYRVNGTTETLIANGDSETKYLVRTWNYATGEYQYKAYTADTLDNNYWSSKSDATINEDKGVVKANIQYFTKTTANNTVATYVFVNALYAKADLDVFVMDRTAMVDGDAFNDIIGAYVAYDAIIDGKEAVLAVTDSSAYGEQYALYNATLTVIGLTDGDVPVYADLNTTVKTHVKEDLTGWQYSNGKVWLYNSLVPNELPGLTPTSDFFFVVATQNTDRVTYTTEVFTDPAKLNDYVENGSFTKPTGYSASTSWADYDVAGTSISALYLRIDVNPANP